MRRSLFSMLLVFGTAGGIALFLPMSGPALADGKKDDVKAQKQQNHDPDAA